MTSRPTAARPTIQFRIYAHKHGLPKSRKGLTAAPEAIEVRRARFGLYSGLDPTQLCSAQGYQLFAQQPVQNPLSHGEQMDSGMTSMETLRFCMRAQTKRLQCGVHERSLSVLFHFTVLDKRESCR